MGMIECEQSGLPHTHAPSNREHMPAGPGRGRGKNDASSAWSADYNEESCGGLNMELEKFVEAKREMERNLGAAIQSEIDKFEAVTGRTPIFIDVDLEDVTSAGSTRRKFTVGTVRADVPLE
jgi:hypothetical protein